ncbi:MAG: CBS domain-containing protein [Cardiobacteriaceae bacterium]|nr:CBS domain-containing protein [Cardiobacteriaceae bacterium]
MIERPLTLHPSMTMAQAFEEIHHRGIRFFPVVDDNGDFMGVFSSISLIELLLPRGLINSLDKKKNPPELNFMQPSLEELRKRLQERGDEPIRDFLVTQDVPLCTPDTSLMELLYTIYLHYSHVIVVEEGSRRFLGIVSIDGILDHIKGA